MKLILAIIALFVGWVISTVAAVLAVYAENGTTDEADKTAGAFAVVGVSILLVGLVSIFWVTAPRE